MKNKILLVGLLLLFIPLVSSALTDNSYLYYDLDSDNVIPQPPSSSHRIIDSYTGNNNVNGFMYRFNTTTNARINDGVYWNRGQFLQQDSRIEVNNNTYSSNLSGTNNYGISMWYYPYNINGFADTEVLFTNSDGGNQRLAIARRNGKIYVTNRADAVFYFGNTSNVLQPNQWYHIVANINANNHAELYINNVLQTEIATTQWNSGGGGLTIGNGDDGGFKFAINGTIDEVFIRNTQFNEDEITLLYRNGLGLNPYTDKLYGIDHNKTYFKNDISYYYQYFNETNQGYEQENLTGTLLSNNINCKDLYCYNGTETIDKNNITLNNFEDFSMMTWIKGNVSGSSYLNIETMQLRHTYRNGGSYIDEIVSFGTTPNGEITLSSTAGSGFTINTGVIPNSSKWQHIAMTYNGSHIIIWNNATIIYNNTHTISFTSGILENISDLLLDSNNGLLDDSVVLDFSIDTTDVEQFIYYTENLEEIILVPVLPPINLTIYAVCDEEITLGLGVNETRIFNWSEATDLQFLTITYGVKTNDIYIINETLETNFEYTFKSPPFIHGEYESVVRACNPYECSSDSCFFDICINNWVEQYSVCTDNEQTKSYYDSNNCVFEYNLPNDNGTIVTCTDLDIEVTNEARKENVLLVIIVIMIVLLIVLQLLNIHRIISFSSAIITIILSILLFTLLENDYIILAISFLLIQVGLLFYLIARARD